jgi:crossover junction endodeoxyribonuclease RuvC
MRVKTKTRIIGVDPGSRITGYGILDTDGFRHTYIASGHISIKGDELPERLGVIFKEVVKIIDSSWARHVVQLSVPGYRLI